MSCIVDFSSARTSIENYVLSDVDRTGMFSRQGNTLSPLSGKDVSPYINSVNFAFGEKVIHPSQDGRYSLDVSDQLAKKYFYKTEEGKRVHSVSSLFSASPDDDSTLNKDQLYTYLNFPEVSELTYEKLVDTLKKINPKFEVQEVDDLTEDGKTELKKFLVSVKTLSKFNGISEEVAHVLIELLPEDSELKKSLVHNVTYFDIYRITLAQYKNVYTKNGQPDYEKIKREAAAKLLAEYIYALSTKDNSRLGVLAQPKEGFLRKWFRQFLSWFGLALSKHTQVYIDTAGAILDGNIDSSFKSDKEIEDLGYTDSVFFRLSEQQLYHNAYTIMESKPPKLLENLHNVSREFSARFHEILKEPQYQALNEELKKTSEGPGKINRLTEISALLADAKYDMKDYLSMEAFIRGIKQFLEAIDQLDTLSEALMAVVRDKQKATDFLGAVNNIRELDAYMSVYKGFQRLLDGETADMFVQMHQEEVRLEQAATDPDEKARLHERVLAMQEIIRSVTETKNRFDTINKMIVSRMKEDLLYFFKDMLYGTNKAVAEQIEFDIAREKAAAKPNPDIIKDLEKRLFSLVTSDEKIIDMLYGRGQDIDMLSNMHYMFAAAVANGDPYVSSAAKYANNLLEGQQRKAMAQIRELYGKIDDIQKKLGETADETGAKITFVDTVYDTYQKKVREVLTWLNPFQNIQPALDERLRVKKDAYKAWYEHDGFDEAEKKRLHEVYRQRMEELDQFLSAHYFRPFVKEYYDLEKEYRKNPVFNEALGKYELASEQVKLWEQKLGESPEDAEAAQQLAMARRNKSNLLYEYDLSGNEKTGKDKEEALILKEYFEKSFHFKEVDEVQTERAYLIGRNRYEQKVDFALQTMRKEPFKNIAEVEKRVRELLKDNRIRLKSVYQSVAGEDINLDIVKIVLMERWEERNRVIERNELYFEDERMLIEALNELQKKGELSPEDILMKENFEEIRRILRGSRDSLQQINPDSLTQEQIEKINQLDDEIEFLKKERPKVTIHLDDMSATDRDIYEGNLLILQDKDMEKSLKVAATAQNRKLEKKYKDSKRSVEMRNLYKLLGSLSDKVPTQYYWDRLSTLSAPLSEFVNIIFSDPEIDDVTKRNIKNFYDSFMNALEEQDSEQMDFNLFTDGIFKEFLLIMKDQPQYAAIHRWFTESHKVKNVYDQNRKEYKELPYVRTSVYYYRKPARKEHQKEVKNKKFLRYKVKNQYRTGYNPATGEVELIEGIHISNKTTASGLPEFLPLRPEDGAPADSPYINKEYYALKNSSDPKDQLRFQYLETLKAAHLAHQQMLPSQLRSWMQVPVMDLSNYEEKKKLPQTIASWKDTFVSFFKKDVTGNAEDQMEVDESIGISGDMLERIPRLGMAQRVPVERVSRDVLKSTANFILKAHEFQGRNEAQPVLKAINTVMRDNNFKGNNSNAERAKIFEKMYSQKVLQEVPDSVFNKRWMRRVSRFLTSNTALRLMFDPIGGVVNWGSANVNNIIEAFAFQHVGPLDLLKGNWLALQVNAHLLADFHKKSNLSYYNLLVMSFDFIQGDFEEDLLDRSSSRDKLSSVRQLAMLPRKVGELQAQVSMGMAILEKHKVLNTIDGKEYPMHEIYEKQGDKMVLKAGFDHRYDPDSGEFFLKMKAKINRINYALHGNYAKINQSEASRHSIGKLAENMKRWFVPAFVRRFGRETGDIMFEEPNEGYYHTAGRALKNIFFNLSSLESRVSWANHFWKTPRYRQNLGRLAADFGQATLMYMVFAFLLGYSGDDKNKELQENAWIHNISILIMLRVYSETTSYVPFPPWGFQELKRNVLTPFAAPADSVSNLAAIAQLGAYQTLYMFGADSLKDDLYYSKDSGYWYSEKGDSKWFKYALRSMGHTGYTFDPDQFIKDFQNLQNRLK